MNKFHIFTLTIIALLVLPTVSIAQFSLDPTFGTKGRVTESFSVVSRASNVIPLANGKTITVGQTTSFSSSYGQVVVYSHINGKRDANFGENGVSIYNPYEEISFVETAEIAPDGKIVVGGSADGGQQSFLMRFTADGQYDTSFGNNGLVLFNTESSIQDLITDLVITNDGKIFASGGNNLNDGVTYRYSVMSFNEDGTFNTNFGDSGIIRPEFEGVTGGTFRSISLISNSHLLLSGNQSRLGARHLVLAKTDLTGNFDDTFGSSSKGKTVTQIPSGLGHRGEHLILSNGKIIAGGDEVMARYSENGLLEYGRANPSNISLKLITAKEDGFFAAGNNFFDLIFFNSDIENLTEWNLPDSSMFFPNEIVFDDAGRILLVGRERITLSFSNIRIERYIEPSEQRRVAADFDGDGKADIAVYRPSERRYYVLKSSDNSFIAHSLAFDVETVIPEDYTGDGVAEYAWWKQVDNSSTQACFGYEFGKNNDPCVEWGVIGDTALGGDYDGDGRTDLAIFRNGVWYIINSSDNTEQIISWGQANDKPMPADYDGDGKTDVAIYRPNAGTWWILNSSDQSAKVVQFGITSDKAVSGDFDGDDKSDIAVYRPADGLWYILFDDGSFSVTRFGLSEDIPVPNYYDGDNQTDIAVWRPSNGTWYILQSQDGLKITDFGSSGDKPLAPIYYQD